MGFCLGQPVDFPEPGPNTTTFVVLRGIANQRSKAATAVKAFKLKTGKRKKAMVFCQVSAMVQGLRRLQNGIKRIH